MTKIIDKPAFYENYGDYGKEFMSEIIQLFLSEYQKDLEEIDIAITHNNAKKLDFHAHKLKSTFRNFTNPCSPGDLSYELEMMGKNNNLTNSRQIFEKLLIQTAIFISDLKEIEQEIR